MADRFVAWSKGKIESLRFNAVRSNAEADRLEGVLNQFLADNGDDVAGSTPPNRVVRDDGRYSGPRRSSKNDVILFAFENAGPNGLGMEDVEREARQAGLQSTRDTLRAYCWNQKQKGYLISLAAGRYAIAPKNETAPESLAKDEGAAPTRSDHNQHREGDVGGGI